jgi:hypothetical protein
MQISLRGFEDDLPEGKKRCPICEELHDDNWEVCYNCKELSVERGRPNPYMDDPEERGYQEYLREVELKGKQKERSVSDWMEEYDNNLQAINAGITEQHGKIWGKAFIDFKYRKVDFFSVIHFANEGSACEKIELCLGSYRESDLFNSFPVKHSNLSPNEVIEGKYDSISMVHQQYLKVKYGTPSKQLSRLSHEIAQQKDNFIDKVNRHGSIQELKKKYKFYGSYYKVNDEKFRSVLVIKDKESESSLFDALVVMMNPGGNYPISGIYKSIDSFSDEKSPIHNLCSPDETQYQLGRLMNMKGWENVLVLNLFDICDPDSSNVIQRYSTENNFIESIFHESRRTELKELLDQLKEQSPIILGWGVSEKLETTKAKIHAFLSSGKRQIVGVQKSGFHYYHPWPRDCRNELRYSWPEIVYNQLIENKNDH